MASVYDHNRLHTMRKITEPVRKSVLDVVQDNLRAAGRTTYITRVVYFGEYIGSHSQLSEKMEGIIQDLRSDYSDVLITGLLLVYPQYYVHLLEASEDIIFQHFRGMYEDNGTERTFGKAISLPTYHHVHQRFFTDWYHVYAIPPTLLDELRGDRLADVQKQISNCLVKVYTLCDHIQEMVRDEVIEMKDILQHLGERLSHYLPESTVLKFLLSSNASVLKSVEDYLRTCTAVPFVNLYNETIWPPPTDFMPRNVLDKYRKTVHRPTDKRRTHHMSTQHH